MPILLSITLPTFSSLRAALNFNTAATAYAMTDTSTYNSTIVEELPSSPHQPNGDTPNIWDLPSIPSMGASRNKSATTYIVEEDDNSVITMGNGSDTTTGSALVIPPRTLPPSRPTHLNESAPSSSLSIAMDGPNPSPHFVSLENVARLYLEMKNERDFLVRESASIFNDRVAVVNQLRQLEVQLNELLQHKGRLEENLDTLGLRDEENREKIAALDEKVANISSESQRFEATVRGLKGDSVSVQPRGATPARPRPKPSAACRRTLYGHTGNVLGVDVCINTRVLITASSDRSLRTWDLDTGRRLDTLYGHEGWVHAVAFAQGGETAVSGSGDRTVKVWDFNDARGRGICRATLRGHEAGVTCVQLDDEGVLVSGSLDKTLRRVDLNVSTDVSVINAHESGVYCFQFLRHGLASGGGDSLIRMHDTRTGQCHRTLQGHSNGAVRALQFADNTLISGGTDHDLRFWDLRTATCTATINVGSRINALKFDDDRVYVGCADRSLKVYNMQSQDLIAEHVGHLGPIMSLAGHEDEFYTGSTDQTTKVWSFKSDKTT